MGAGVFELKDQGTINPTQGSARIHTPEEIAEQLGGMSVKSLGELIRTRGLETTTLGFVGPSPRGGRKRRIWGMTDAQLGALLEARRGSAASNSPG
jgi:hypothetical protein